MSQRELAEAVGVSVGGIHYVLKALIEKGHLKLSNFTAARDKRRYAYVLTPKGLARKAALTRAFLARKMEEYEALRQEIESLGAELDDHAPQGRVGQAGAQGRMNHSVRRNFFRMRPDDGTDVLVGPTD
ncbi:MarR family EPS-associated transcriptional regulator [Jhaorihella thermophila]